MCILLFGLLVTGYTAVLWHLNNRIDVLESLLLKKEE